MSRNLHDQLMRVLRKAIVRAPLLDGAIFHPSSSSGDAEGSEGGLGAWRAAEDDGPAPPSRGRRGGFVAVKLSLGAQALVT